MTETVPLAAAVSDAASRVRVRKNWARPALTRIAVGSAENTTEDIVEDGDFSYGS